MTDIALTNGTVITMNQRREVIYDGGVAIEGNKIAEVGKTSEIKEKTSIDREIDCQGRLILPGLIDTHVHLGQALIRACADDLPLVPWLNERVLPLQGIGYQEGDGKLSAQLCTLEMIKSGTTTFVEALLHWKYIDEMTQAVAESGMRGAVSKSLMNLPGYADQPEAIPECMREDGEETLKQTEKMIKKWHGEENNKIHIWYGPRTPGGATVEFYRECAEQADKHDTGITIHLGEVKDDIQYMKNEFDMTPMEFMEHCNLVGENVIYAHGVWIPEEDFKLLKEHECTVSHNPASNLKLGSGIAPIPEMLDAGVNVGLGCDGGPSNDNYDLIRDMKLAALIHKGRLLDPTVMPAETVLEMATVNGAKPTLWGGDIGSLEPGTLADLIVVNLNKTHSAPVRNPISNLIYAGHEGNVETSIIDGEIVMENREVKTLDEKKILEEVIELAPELDQRLDLDIDTRWPTK
ncbi:hypothetical protein AKJ48_01320 [candidate division MSBL1 archaeon SCGC-AAA261O19]|uniref:Amidohydrolase-related domain-containing protein n=2 Tax=candidate division MSBL1 TaxID=215777 RepID=A0A133V204_9EURY|nr:hypothetical protein AKJ42_00500 [candidate division MSBL1 archaeon SCGC-AAA261C02]KXB04831.1 hypothetical protein AKJ48_01320 [candidate division MSBL1 archaeon SCGC-AAA261O19]